MFKFIFVEFKSNIKVFLLSFFVLLFLLSSNLNLLSVSVSVRDNIYDSLSGLYYEYESDSIVDLNRIDLPSSSYAITYSNIDYVTNTTATEYPKINNVYIGNDTDKKGKKVVGNLFYYNQDGFYKYTELNKSDNPNVIYLKESLLEKINAKVGDSIIFDTSKEQLVLAIAGSYTKSNRYDSDYFIPIETISNISQYTNMKILTYFNLVNLRYYNKAIDVISSLYNIDKEKLKSQYYEDYISLANVVVLVLVSIFIFILALIIIISYKLIKVILVSRKEMILTLSVLGMGSRKIHFIYYLIFALFYFVIFLFAIGADFILNIFIDNAFVSAFNFSYAFHLLPIVIVIYFLLIMVTSFLTTFSLFRKIKTNDMFSQMKKEEKI